MKIELVILGIFLLLIVGCTGEFAESPTTKEQTTDADTLDTPRMEIKNDTISPQRAKELRKIEVRNYEGKRLDSVTDFRENSIKGPQYVELDTYSLEVTGLVNKPMKLSYQDVLKNQKYTKVITLHCVEGWSATVLWEGILLKDLFNQAELKEEANTVIFHAYDGYTSSLSLDYILNNDILLAYMMNNVTLPQERGFPFQLVAEDKWGYKWVKWITKIELSDDPDYKGTWERAGYNNNGDLDGPKLEGRKK